MVITDKFVFIHMPKTGGTFVTSVLAELHRRNPLDSGRADYASGHYGPAIDLEPKHGTCLDIPAPHRNKPIVSCLRNPYDWYVSQYEFGWWKRTRNYQPLDSAIQSILADFEREYPHYPDISFEEFMKYCGRESLVYECKEPGRFGLHTHFFARYYFRSPNATLSRLMPGCLEVDAFKAEMFDVRFLRTDILNGQIQGFLASMGYRADDLAFISRLEKILPEEGGRRGDQPWQSYYTPALKRDVREKDWVLFDLFPEFDY